MLLHRSTQDGFKKLFGIFLNCLQIYVNLENFLEYLNQNKGKKNNSALG
jgi:hypothetical protein